MWGVRHPDALRRRLTSRDVAFWTAYQRVEWENIVKFINTLMGAEPEYTVENPMPEAEMQDNLKMQLAARRGNNSTP